MKSPLILSGIAISLLCAEQTLSTQYKAEQALRVETSTHSELEVTDMQMTRDGEPVEGRGGAGGGFSSSSRSVTVDRYLAVAGSAPARVQRSYEDLEGDTVMSFGGEDRSSSLESPFSGVVIEITRDEDGEVSAKVEEGSGPPSELMAKLRPELSLDALLPAGPVSEGDEWELDGVAIRRVLGLEVSLFQRPEPEDGGGRGGGRRGGRGGGGQSVEQQMAAAEWSGRATFKGIEDHEGVSCALIALALSGELESDDGEGSSSTFGAELEGSLWIDLTQKRPLALAIEGSLDSESDSVREREGSTMEIHRASEGTFTHKVKVSATAFEVE